MSTGKRPWYKWYPKDFVADEKVQSLSPIAELIYRRLLDVMWQSNECRLLNVCLRLANMVGRGLTQEQFENAWSEIQTEGFELFKTTDDNRWIYSKLYSGDKVGADSAGYAYRLFSIGLLFFFF